MRSARARNVFLLLGFSIGFALTPNTAIGTILSVRQDGTGDFDNVTAAVAAAGAGDSIAVGPGSYAEGATFSIDVALAMFSTDGRDVTTLDGANAHRIFETTTAGIRLEGLTFAHGLGPGSFPTGGGAAFMYSGSQVVMEDCVVRDHFANWGGAIYVTDSSMGNSTTLTANNCLFQGNYATDTAGAIYVVNGAVGNFNDCTFLDNATGLKGGTFHVIRSVGNFDRCLFRGNESGDVAGAIFFEDSSGLVQECTFYDHTSPGSIAGTIVVELTRGTNITRNIFAGDTAGYGLRYYNSSDPHSCNVFWDNADGAVGFSALAADEVVADPRFCDPAAGELTISDDSPAAAANSACGQAIGAFPVACSLPPPPTPAPRIVSIADVPDDDGGQVRIRWERSAYDAPAQPFVIPEYGIYRRAASQVGNHVHASSSDAKRSRDLQLDGWDFVATVPARGDSIYQYVAPTLCNSHHARTCWSVFFVSAMTSDPLTFFDSAPDSGQSTDDLPPAPPGNPHASASALGTEVEWDAPSDPNVVEFYVYRGTGDFAVTSGAQVGATTANSWIDAEAPEPVWSYKVTALDAAGNESEAALWEPTPSSLQPHHPLHYALHRNEPNPFNPMTTIYFDVPNGGGRLALRVYDARGNLVRTLIDGFEAVGRAKAVTWNGLNDGGRRVSSGVYFCRLQATGYDRALRLVLIE